MNKRRELTSEERAEASRLKAIYERRKAEAKSRGERLTQADVGDRCRWESGQSAASQYLNGKVALNLDALLRLARVLQFDPAEVSPRLTADITQVANPWLSDAAEKESYKVSERKEPFITGRSGSENIQRLNRIAADLSDEQLKLLVGIAEVIRKG